MLFCNEFLDSSVGHYYVCSNEEAQLFEDQLTKEDCVFCKVGEKSDLNGFFNRELTFIGLHPDNKQTAVFYIGNSSDLFGSKKYYEDVLILSTTRIFKLYGTGHGRDYNFVNNKWK